MDTIYKEEEIYISEKETAIIIFYDSGKKSVWKYGFGELAYSDWYHYRSIEELKQDAIIAFQEKCK